MREDVCEIEIDEALEVLWTLEEKGDANIGEFGRRLIENLGDSHSDPHRERFRQRYGGKISERTLERLLKRDLVREEGGEMRLTDSGRRTARGIVRRHRLAERLLTDLLDMGKENIRKPACKFEHLLSEEVTERICTLLGHPKECPHGLPIPGGKCCEVEKETIRPAIEPLSKARVGDRLVVAYIRTRNHPRLHRLLSFGIGPDSEITLHQKRPVYVVRTDETDIALEEDIVKDIFVKSH